MDEPVGAGLVPARVGVGPQPPKEQRIVGDGLVPSRVDTATISQRGHPQGSPLRIDFIILFNELRIFSKEGHVCVRSGGVLSLRLQLPVHLGEFQQQFLQFCEVVVVGEHPAVGP